VLHPFTLWRDRENQSRAVGRNLHNERDCGKVDS
jgi:hypothetical protein